MGGRRPEEEVSSKPIPAGGPCPARARPVGRESCRLEPPARVPGGSPVSGDRLDRRPDGPVVRSRRRSCLEDQGVRDQGGFHEASSRAVLLVHRVPLYRGPKDEWVSQYNVRALKRAGLVKFDFIARKALTVIRKVLDFVGDVLLVTSKIKSS